MNMAEILMEQGQTNCVNYPGNCNLRPCTSAQDVFCCAECAYFRNCGSSCRKAAAGVEAGIIGGRDGKTKMFAKSRKKLHSLKH